MNFRFSYLLLLFIGITGNANAQNHFLHRSGRVIIDSNRKEMKLRGVNLGGWLLWEEWIWGGGFHSQTQIMNGLAQMAGKEEAVKFRDSIYLNFITVADIKKIAGSHFNVVRIPFNSKIFDETAEPSAFKGIGWRVLDSVLAWCRQYGVYAVLDMHAAPGGQNSFFISDPSKPGLWESENNRQRTIALWKAIATRYKNNTAIAGYDLLNEPNPGRNADLPVLYHQIISAIREVDINHMVILEGSSFATNFSMFSELPDSNIAFSFHLYTWFGGDPDKKVVPYRTLSTQLNVPIWCGEWGENKYDVLEKTREAFEKTANNFSGWCFWTWKKVPAGKFPALNSIVAGDDWKTLIDAVRHEDNRNTISRSFALQAMKEFLSAIRAGNNFMGQTLLKILE